MYPQKKTNNGAQVKAPVSNLPKASQPAKTVMGDKITFVKKSNTEKAIELERIIANYQQDKRSKKLTFEVLKNEKINQITQNYAKARTLPDADLEKLQKEERAEKVVALKEYVNWYKKSSGWHLNDIRKQANEFKFSGESGDIIKITDGKTQEVLYEIVFQNSRFSNTVADPNRINDVYTKKGTEKEYVKDANGIFISRFVTRGCSAEQIDSLLRNKIMHPRNRTNIIGDQINEFDFKGRKSTDTMTQKELEFVQLRDGSGKDQRFLSATHINENKVVHSNHGETFTAEYTIKIDLSKISNKSIFNQHTNEAMDKMESLARIGKMKKTVQEELETVKYSVIKNRETLLSEIPISAITHIKEGDGPWQTLEDYRNMNDKYLAEVRLKQKQEEERQRAKEQREEELRKAKQQEEEDQKELRRQNAEKQKARIDNKPKLAAQKIVELIAKKKNTGLNSAQLLAIKDAEEVESFLQSDKKWKNITADNVSGKLDDIINGFKAYYVV